MWRETALLLLIYITLGLSAGLVLESDAHWRKLETLKSSILDRISRLPSFSPSPAPSWGTPVSRVLKVTSYGADPTCTTDSSDAIMLAISDALGIKTNRSLMEGIADVGGAQVHLEGGCYLIGQPLMLNGSGSGNFMIHGGSLQATDDFPLNRSLIELGPASASMGGGSRSKAVELGTSFASGTYNHEFVTIRNLLLNCNFRGGGISVVNSLRTSIDNCYIAHFTTTGIFVRSGHETFIRNCFIGQHITAGGDPNEKKFSGTGIHLEGNDNVVTDVVIFSAGTGVIVAGQANVLTGVHCYNKATHYGGIGIHLKVPQLSQTRIMNCYLDYNGIVAEDPVQLLISGSFFLGNAFVLLQSSKGIIKGVTIVDNMFSGTGGSENVDIVQLDQSNGPFTQIEQVVIERNNGIGMHVKSTSARGHIHQNGTRWEFDFSDVLLFSDFIKHAQYSFQTNGFIPRHAITNTSANRVIVEADSSVYAKVFVSVSQDTNNSH